MLVTPESVLATITTEKSTFTETDLDKALRGLAADKLARAAIKAAILDRRDVLTLAVDQDGERRMAATSGREMASARRPSASVTIDHVSREISTARNPALADSNTIALSRSGFLDRSERNANVA